jgi:hypothetical protein
MTTINRIFATVIAATVAAGCGSDASEVDVSLTSHAFHADFGAPSGTVPTATCDEAATGGCETAQGLTFTTIEGADVSVDLGCNWLKFSCFAQANARLPYTVDVLQDRSFMTKVGPQAIARVRMTDLGYTIPTNTLTFDIPQVNLFVGPAGTRAETDPGVYYVGSTGPIAAGGTVVAEPGHLTIANDTPARGIIEQSIQSKQTFVFLFAATPRLEAGASMPAGALEIDLVPTVRLGFPP